LPVLRGGKWGYIDLSGKIVIAPQFELAECFYEGRAAVRLNGKWGFIDPTGKLAISPEFTSVSSFSDGLAAVFIDASTPQGRVYGYIDQTGQMVIKCPAACGRSYYEGMMAEAVEVFRCVDELGRPVPKQYPCTPDAASNSRAVFVDTWGYYDKAGKLVIPGIFHSGCSRFSEGLAAVQPHGTQKMGFIDKFGAFVIRPQFDRAEAFSEGLAPVRIGDFWGFVDRLGKLVIEPQFEGVGSFSDGLATFRFRGKSGYIDQTGRIVIPPRYLETAPFSEGLAAVYGEDGKTGYIDKSGAFVVPAAFTFTAGVHDAPFSEGIALVRAETGAVYIDRTGKVIATVGEATSSPR
jgi:hypothetical protein